LVHSIGAGDQRALYALYQRTHRIVFTVIMRIVGDGQSAEELTLDVFHDVWRRAPEYDPEGGPALGWILNQARSRAIDRLRFNGRKKRIAPSPGPDGQQVAAGGCDGAIDLEHQGRLVRNALSVLAPAERLAIESAFFGELTYAQVAVRLNEPLGTIKTRIRSGLRKLRSALSEGGSGNDE